MRLRKYQDEGLTKSVARFDAGVMRQLIQLPTAMGKTPLFSCVPEYFKFKGHARMLVLAHTEELAGQAADKLRKWNPGLRVGIEMGANRSSPSDDFVVGSPQTLGRAGTQRLLQFDPEEFAAVIVDEAHHAIGQTYMNVFEHFGFFTPGTVRLLMGVTATPNRGDGQELAKVFEEVVYSYPIQKAVDDGWLADIRGIRVTSQTSLDNVHTMAGDFAQGELAHEVNTPERNALIVQSYIENAPDRQTVSFCVDIQHAKDLALMFQRRGVPAQAIWGDDEERRSKLAAHVRGDIKVLTNCQVLTEGYDDWHIGCVIMARPTKSQLLFVQCIGRGMRIPEGINNLVEARTAGVKIAKSDCLFIDVVDNTKKHCLVTIPSVFGLNAAMDLHGRSAIAALHKVEEVQKANPGVSLKNLLDINNIKAHVEKVSLFELKVPEELVGITELRWYQLSDGSFMLKLPGREKITVTPDLLGKWHVRGQVNENAFEQDGFSDLPGAITFAESMLRTFGGKRMLNMTKATMKSGGDKMTDPQAKMMARFLRIRIKETPEGKVDRSCLPEQYRNITKQEASNFISNQIRGRWV